MDTITADLIQDVANSFSALAKPAVVHTVTITLNGWHGGADVIVEGVDTSNTNEFRHVMEQH